MPAIHGGLSEEWLDEFTQKMVDNGRFDSQSEALEFCVKYTLINKYNVQMED